MADASVVLGVTGIVVSGVVGPTVASLLARRARTREFHREQVAKRRDQLRTLLDAAAALLASAPTNLRVIQAAVQGDALQRAQAWTLEIFPISQRLQLWLPATHEVVTAYEDVRETLIAAAEAGGGPAGEDAVERFEAQRTQFLDASRRVLLGPIPGTEGTL